MFSGLSPNMYQMVRGMLGGGSGYACVGAKGLEPLTPSV